MDPDNVTDKYPVCVKKNTSIVGHLPLGKYRKFAKMIFYFLRADQDGEFKIIITGKEVNLADGSRTIWGLLRQLGPGFSKFLTT